jgi:mono/diheme cytochrome c family protein
VLRGAALGWALALVMSWGANLPLEAQRAGAQPASPAPPASPEQAFLTQYCIACHNERAKVGGLALDTLDVARVGTHAETWEKVVRKIKTGMMPPSGVRRPERAVLDGFASEVGARLDRAVPPNAGLSTPALHRLNRSEYANAVRDLLAIDADVNTLLPGDGSTDGFDNIAEALAVSPSLIQGYVTAAMKISRQAVGDRTVPVSQVTYTPPPGFAQDRHIDGLPLGTRGGMIVTHQFPLDAEYELSVGGAAQGAAGLLDVTIDGEKVAVTNPRGFKVHVKAGPHKIGLALVDRQRGAGVDEIYSDFRVDAAFTAGGGVQGLTITGPTDATGVGDTPSRRRIFSCRPQTAAEEPACARTILASLARRAYRGPVSDAEIATLLDFYRKGRADADFEIGIQQALARILVAPRFVFRTEEEPKTVAAGSAYRLSDVELASRLSFFLWSSIPDDELLELAIKNRLRDPQTLERQVRRMLADPKAEALVRNLAGQWLSLRELTGLQTDAKNFDENLRQSFRRETEMLFGTIVREDRSLIELLDADYTFVDERLARHYGIPDVRGSHFRRVALDPASPRRGLLGHGSFLTVTSVSTRTSPVSRGKWILQNLLGTPPPEPPPGVEVNLDPPPGETKPTTLRQRLEMHRASAVCASCHRIMDPMGFALENFDLVGTWRDKEGETPIDASGQLADGSPLRGPDDLRRAVLSRSSAFMETATEKLLIYALGRPLHYDDMPAVRAIARKAEQNGNQFSAMVSGIIESRAFQMRVKKTATVATN